jgi:hypothetical protein
MQKYIKNITILISYIFGVTLVFRVPHDERPVRVYSEGLPKKVSSAPIVIVENPHHESSDPLTEDQETSKETEIKAKEQPVKTKPYQNRLKKKE